MSPAGRVAWAMVLVLVVVRYDFWFWTDATLVFGFMPVGLFYHVMISLAAGVTWALVVRYAWPSWIEEWASAQGEHDQS